MLFLHWHWQEELSQVWEVLFRQASLSLVRWGRQWQEQESGENCCLTLQDPGPREHSHLQGPRWCSSSMLVQYGVLFT